LKGRSSSYTLEVEQDFNQEGMMNRSLLYQWMDEIATWMPSLNTWQVENLALFSLGVIRAESSHQQAIARQIACGERVESAARRLRRFIANSSLDLGAVFEGWTRWVVRAMDADQVYLLVDETKLRDWLGVMMVGVAYEGRCIPLAWHCYQANCAAAYPPEGQVGMIEELLKHVKAGLPDTKRVIVLADRGIGTSPALCRRVAALGWDYLLRVTCQSKICTETGDYTIAQMVQPGEVWSAEGRIFKKRGQLPAQARAIWTEGYDEPWAWVTNASDLTGYEYACRNWQEQSFRDLKSGGWQWGTSRLRNPDHMARFILLLVTAYGWVLALGSYAVHWGRARSLHRRPGHTPRRQWSLFKEGLQLFAEYVQRLGVCLKLCFISDHRLCRNLSARQPPSGEGEMRGDQVPSPAECTDRGQG
jgi:hypothetical protein